MHIHAHRYRITFEACVFVGLALIVVYFAVQVAMYAINQVRHPPTKFELVEGTLSKYGFSGKSVHHPSVDFQIIGSQATFWTYALEREAVQASWKAGTTKLRFYVESSHGTKHSIQHHVKTYGLWVNDLPVQTLEQKLADDQTLLFPMALADIFAFAFAAWLLSIAIRYARVKVPRAKQ